MNERSFIFSRPMTPKSLDPATSTDRRHQIVEAAMACFARRGFHQTTMHDISEAAGISVGLIYRYFEGKDQVIATMGELHLADLSRKIEEASGTASLAAALEHVLWCDKDADVAPGFVVDLFAEAGRNPHVRRLVAQVHHAVILGVTDLIARSPEASRLAPGITPADAAQIVFQAIHGRLFDEIVHSGTRTEPEIRAARSETLRRITALLFPVVPDAS